MDEGVVPLHLRESLEDGRHSTYTVSGGSGDQDGHEKCTGAGSYSVLVRLSIVRTLTIFFHRNMKKSTPTWRKGLKPSRLVFALDYGHLCRISLRRVVAVELVGSGKLDSDG